MVEIKLTRGQVVMVDDEDYEELSKYKWHSIKSLNGWYAVRSISKGTYTSKLYMHRQITGFVEGMVVDHIDRNGLNCQKSNLRLCTHAENARNQAKGKRGIIAYKGVSMHGERFRAQINYHGNRISLGVYTTKEEAALAYNLAAEKYHGEYKCINLL